MPRAEPHLFHDQDYMSPAQLTYFRQRLQAWRESLVKSLDLQRKTLGEPSSSLPDWLDSAALRTERELSYVQRQRALRLIEEIDAALARIDTGEYGYCCHSGEQIGLERLLAMPTARYSVTSQEELELRRRIHR